MNLSLESLKVSEFSYFFFDQEGTISELKGKSRHFTESLDNIEFDMIYLSGNIYEMGSHQDELGSFDNERPVHKVQVEPFFIGKFPVTQSLWKKVMGNNPSYFEGENKPVEGISWSHAYHFCEFLKLLTNKNYRLISESEWEYACRGNTNTPYYTGYHIDEKMANFNLIGSMSETKVEPLNQTTDVGLYPPNPFGLYDMCGNVWEWCADVGHKSYSSMSENHINNSIPCMELQDLTPWVLRGGSWDNKARTMRSANRFKSCATNRFNTLSFRIAISAN